MKNVDEHFVMIRIIDSWACHRIYMPAAEVNKYKAADKPTIFWPTFAVKKHIVDQNSN